MRAAPELGWPWAGRGPALLVLATSCLLWSLGAGRQMLVASGDVQETRVALLELYLATLGQDWVLAQDAVPWGTAPSPCTWAGVVCCQPSGNSTNSTGQPSLFYTVPQRVGTPQPATRPCSLEGRLMALALTGVNLTGTLPPSLARLGPEVLLLSDNPGLRGQLPPAMLTLEQLLEIDVRNTSMSCATTNTSSSSSSGGVGQLSATTAAIACTLPVPFLASRASMTYEATGSPEASGVALVPAGAVYACPVLHYRNSTMPSLSNSSTGAAANIYPVAALASSTSTSSGTSSGSSNGNAAAAAVNAAEILPPDAAVLLADPSYWLYQSCVCLRLPDGAGVAAQTPALIASQQQQQQVGGGASLVVASCQAAAALTSLSAVENGGSSGEVTLAVGELVGIIVGVAAGAALLSVLGIAAYRLLRARRQRRGGGDGQQHAGGSSSKPHGGSAARLGDNDQANRSGAGWLSSLGDWLWGSNPNMRLLSGERSAGGIAGGGSNSASARAYAAAQLLAAAGRDQAPPAPPVRKMVPGSLFEAKRSRPPGSHPELFGHDVTLVATDVEGSTELWEWHPELMNIALALHDRTVRLTLAACCGYEVTTEGDAFLVAFHEPVDAVRWALLLQSALLKLDWPPLLLEHPLCRPRPLVPVATAFSSSNSGPDPASHKDAPLLVLFKGLAVRMGIATGVPSAVREHPITHRMQYTGAVLRLATGIAELGSGGQVLLEPMTFKGIHNKLEELDVEESEVQELTDLVRGQPWADRQDPSKSFTAPMPTSVLLPHRISHAHDSSLLPSELPTNPSVIVDEYTSTAPSPSHQQGQASREGAGCVHVHRGRSAAALGQEDSYHLHPPPMHATSVPDFASVPTMSSGRMLMAIRQSNAGISQQSLQHTAQPFALAPPHAGLALIERSAWEAAAALPVAGNNTGGAGGGGGRGGSGAQHGNISGMCSAPLLTLDDDGLHSAPASSESAGKVMPTHHAALNTAQVHSAISPAFHAGSAQHPARHMLVSGASNIHEGMATPNVSISSAYRHLLTSLDLLLTSSNGIATGAVLASNAAASAAMSAALLPPSAPLPSVDRQVRGSPAVAAPSGLPSDPGGFNVHQGGPSWATLSSPVSTAAAAAAAGRGAGDSRDPLRGYSRKPAVLFRRAMTGAGMDGERVLGPMLLPPTGVHVGSHPSSLSGPRRSHTANMLEPDERQQLAPLSGAAPGAAPTSAVALPSAGAAGLSAHPAGPHVARHVGVRWATDAAAEAALQRRFSAEHAGGFSMLPRPNSSSRSGAGPLGEATERRTSGAEAGYGDDNRAANGPGNSAGSAAASGEGTSNGARTATGGVVQAQPSAADVTPATAPGAHDDHGSSHGGLVPAAASPPSSSSEAASAPSIASRPQLVHLPLLTGERSFRRSPMAGTAHQLHRLASMSTAGSRAAAGLSDAPTSNIMATNSSSLSSSSGLAGGSDSKPARLVRSVGRSVGQLSLATWEGPPGASPSTDGQGQGQLDGQGDVPSSPTQNPDASQQHQQQPQQPSPPAGGSSSHHATHASLAFGIFSPHNILTSGVPAAHPGPGRDNPLEKQESRTSFTGGFDAGPSTSGGLQPAWGLFGSTAASRRPPQYGAHGAQLAATSSSHHTGSPAADNELTRSTTGVDKHNPDQNRGQSLWHRSNSDVAEIDVSALRGHSMRNLLEAATASAGGGIDSLGSVGGAAGHVGPRLLALRSTMMLQATGSTANRAAKEALDLSIGVESETSDPSTPRVGAGSTGTAKVPAPQPGRGQQSRFRPSRISSTRSLLQDLLRVPSISTRSAQDARIQRTKSPTIMEDASRHEAAASALAAAAAYGTGGAALEEESRPAGADSTAGVAMGTDGESPMQSPRVADSRKPKERTKRSFIKSLSARRGAAGADVPPKLRLQAGASGKEASQGTSTPSPQTASGRSLNPTDRHSLIVVDMGTHRLKIPALGAAYGDLYDGVQVIQILPAHLKHRAAYHPPLKSQAQLAPSFFDAPGAKQALMPLAPGQPPSFPRCSLMFIQPAGYSAVANLRLEVAERSGAVFCSAVREVLQIFSAYECQEYENTFMVACAGPRVASEVALSVHDWLLHADWPTDLLEDHPEGRVLLSEDGRPLLRGFRAKVGIFTGVPLSVVPHATTGRADYFGALVNRAARLMAGAKAGQTLLDKTAGLEVLKEWRQLASPHQRSSNTFAPGSPWVAVPTWSPGPSPGPPFGTAAAAEEGLQSAGAAQQHASATGSPSLVAYRLAAAANTPLGLPLPPPTVTRAPPVAVPPGASRPPTARISSSQQKDQPLAAPEVAPSQLQSLPASFRAGPSAHSQEPEPSLPPSLSPQQQQLQQQQQQQPGKQRQQEPRQGPASSPAMRAQPASEPTLIASATSTAASSSTAAAAAAPAVARSASTRAGGPAPYRVPPLVPSGSELDDDARPHHLLYHIDYLPNRTSPASSGALLLHHPHQHHVMMVPNASTSPGPSPPPGRVHTVAGNVATSGSTTHVPDWWTGLMVARGTIANKLQPVQMPVQVYDLGLFKLKGLSEGQPVIAVQLKRLALTLVGHNGGDDASRGAREGERTSGQQQGGASGGGGGAGTGAVVVARSNGATGNAHSKAEQLQGTAMGLIEEVMVVLPAHLRSTDSTGAL